MAKMPKPSEIMDAVPNATCFVLYQHIVYCSRYAKVEWHGKAWFASSYDDYAAATGLTKRQVERSFASLRQAGLIETEQHIYAGKNLTHVRLTCEGGKPGKPAGGPPNLSSGGEHEFPENGELPILREDQTEYQTQEGSEEADEMEPNRPTSRKKTMASDVASILKSNNAKAEENFSVEALDDAMAVAIEAPTQPRLGKVFMVAWVLAGYACRPGLSLKEMRQLSNLIDACDDTKVGVFLIAEMVENWGSLTTYLKENYKKSEPPDRPNIGYALAARVSVVQWLSERVGVDHAQTFASDEDEEDWSDLK